MSAITLESLAEAFAKKDSEIERLKAEGPWQQIKCPYCLKEHSYKPSRIIREQKALITELCDALEQVSWRAEDRAQLIKSAREVIR